MFKDMEGIDSFGATEIKAVSDPINKKVNKYYQDSSFKELFKEEKYQRLFLRDLGTVPNYDTIELENIELVEMFSIDTHNDVCFRAGERLIILMEHQSSINRNMPIRLLLYVAEEYKRLFQRNNKWKELFCEDTIILPRPEFYVVYTGEKPWNCSNLKLSDSFVDTVPQNSYLELSVAVYTQDNSCGIVKEYTSFIARIKELKSTGLMLKEAIANAIDEFESVSEMGEFLERKSDIMSILDRQLTDEERDAVILEMKERKITQQVTQQSIKEMYDLLISAGQKSEDAIKAIAAKKGVTVTEIEKIVIE